MYDYYTGEVTNNAQTSSQSKTPQMYENNSSNLYQDYEFFLNYDRTLDRHHIAVMLGNTNELRENRSLTVHRTASSNQELEEKGRNGYNYYQRHFKKEKCMNNLFEIIEKGERSNV